MEEQADGFQSTFACLERRVDIRYGSSCEKCKGSCAFLFLGGKEMMTSTEMQTSLGRCQKLIRYGIEKGMTELELNQLIVYASAPITLKADIHHVDRG